jgi:hypothetical protein
VPGGATQLEAYHATAAAVAELDRAAVVGERAETSWGPIRRVRPQDGAPPIPPGPLGRHEPVWND